MTGRRRLFAALRPPVTAITHLTEVVEELHVAEAWRRVLRHDLWHVTVAYVGDLPAERLPEATGAMAEAAAETPPLTLALAGGGRFGRGRSNIVYTGLAADVAGLTRLAERTRTAFRAAGIPYDERPYRPHLTLAGAGAGIGNAESAEDLVRLRRYRGPDWTADRIGLYHSHAGDTPHYEPVAEAPFTGAA
ncbi:2'-5' RNA ligase [Stackebrandtia albiflava]|uniref:RNA 2',3'-cyclic phosphodiesterase n=1 Tax=Stackebrandtia albiflava TaxID=406432 RepID=A0A562ULC9_9ACTN|nr:RNA 2',3'-cyclic phosphodiesterase [Stackebrandtia albiflava]TWJ06415.1 2'-5' RNA ligase [Stackebrandtia albiflava]